MIYEEHEDYIVFREVTIAQEMAQKYEDGLIVKTAEELERADKRSQETMPVTMMYDSHKDERLVGFAKPPKGIPSFKNGKIKRDIFYDKEELTEDEIQGLRNAPLFHKKDLSIKFKDKTKYRKDMWNGIHVDGYSKDMDIKTIAWVELGRCSTQDGCGLTRSDETVIRYDSLSELHREDETECIANKLKLFISEGMEASQAQAAAIAYCKEKEYKHDSVNKQDNVDRLDKETIFMADDKDKKNKTPEELEKEKKEKENRKDVSELILEGFASVKEQISSLQPIETDSVRKDSDDKEHKDEESESKDAFQKEILERMDALKESNEAILKENSELKERIDNLPLPKLRPVMGKEDLDKHLAEQEAKE